MKPKNPFVIRGYAGAEYFCDRQKEATKLISAFENDYDVTLIVPRLFGKTGLIHHVFKSCRPTVTPQAEGMPKFSFALNDLRSHDLVCETDRGWIVYDRLFGEWLSRFPS